MHHLCLKIMITAESSYKQAIGIGNVTPDPSILSVLKLSRTLHCHNPDGYENFEMKVFYSSCEPHAALVFHFLESSWIASKSSGTLPVLFSSWYRPGTRRWRLCTVVMVLIVLMKKVRTVQDRDRPGSSVSALHFVDLHLFQRLQYSYLEYSLGFGKMANPSNFFLGSFQIR